MIARVHAAMDAVISIHLIAAEVIAAIELIAASFARRIIEAAVPPITVVEGPIVVIVIAVEAHGTVVVIDHAAAARAVIVSARAETEGGRAGGEGDECAFD
jgi:hypothetical protein